MPETIKDSAGEIWHSSPSSDVLQQAMITAMRQLSDGQAIINKTMEKMADRMEVMHTEVITLKAQDLQTSIKLVDSKAEANNKANDVRLKILEVQYARMLGVFLPLGMFGSGALAWFTTYMMGKMFHA